jgi:Fur family transcriptional regulator, ferric uptake regulator
MPRNTRQREAIRTVLLDAVRPLSPGEVHKLARAARPGLGIATVYRALKSLAADGIIIQIDIPGQNPRWEAAHQTHHHHFRCRSCDKLFEIHGCPADLDHLLPAGYVLENHYILLEGQCEDCAANPGPRHKRTQTPGEGKP